MKTDVQSGVDKRLCRVEADILLTFYKTTKNALYMWTAIQKLLSAGLPLDEECEIYLERVSNSIADAVGLVLTTAEQTGGNNQTNRNVAERQAAIAAQKGLLKSFELSSATRNCFKDMLHDNAARHERNLRVNEASLQEYHPSVHHLIPQRSSTHPAKGTESEKRSARRLVRRGRKLLDPTTGQV